MGEIKTNKIILLILITTLLAVGCSNTKDTPPVEKNKETNPEENKAQDSRIIEEDLSEFFTGYEGCFVLFNKDQNEYTIYNRDKSSKQVSPCSTYKIIHSLIGLETNVLTDENTVFKWDGTKHQIQSWNQDQTLGSAVANSVVWYFQLLASQIGEARMQDYLDKYDYGNRDISGGLTKFWLQSTLKISPIEQVELLKKLYNYQLPASKKNIDIVKKIITLSDENGIKLSGKTGSGGSKTNSTYVNGWFVGYVEKENNVYFFATNIEANGDNEKNAGGAEAKEITLKILHDKKIINP